MKENEILKEKYLELLAQQYPSRYAAFTEIINLQAILNLPKGTEHFVSDLHGEYDAFCHIINNCSGVIREKVDIVFQNLYESEKADLCTLVYYPHEKLELLKKQGVVDANWYKTAIKRLIVLAKFISSKYTRSKVRKAIPREFNYIIDELMHAMADEDNNRLSYHEKIFDSIIETGSAHHFINSLASLIKRLAVDHLHLVGDIFDRGSHPDKIIDLLMQHHSLDIEWGNHDILWMGAACGSLVSIMTVVRNNVLYDNYELLENGYGISMRSLVMFAEHTYKEEEKMSALKKALAVLVFKLQGHVIKRHKEFNMEKRLLLDKIDFDKGTVVLEGKEYAIRTKDFPTVDRNDPYQLTPEEESVCLELKQAFLGSKRLQQHVAFLYKNGSMYRCYNGNLLYHGCIPLNEDGTFAPINCKGRYLTGKAYMDYADSLARKAWIEKDQDSLDNMWYLWCGIRSPLSGRIVKTFERALCEDKSTWEEPRDPYYSLYYREDICKMILKEFGLDPEKGHIINGHTPIKVREGEDPIRGNGRLIVIDGGFCHAYHKTTGIAGYTLIFNSHGLRLKAHRPFTTIEDALLSNTDIHSDSYMVETFRKRMMVGDSDAGQQIRYNIKALTDLLHAYRSGAIAEN